MIIAVNTRLGKEEQPEGYEDYMFDILGSLTKKFPQHQFLYIFDKSYDKNFRFAKNVVPIIAGPETRSSLRLQYWLNYKIPAILRKHKADVFVSMEGICSLRTKNPQCLLISDLCFLHHPELIKKTQARFYKKFTPSFLSKAKTIATVSAFSKQVIVDQYKISAGNVDVIRPGIADIFKPVDWDEKEIIREKYAAGKAYFLFSGDINRRSNLINLLKAFSFFKQRQKSNMMLLIAGNADESFKKGLRTYKLRNEVLLLENLEKEDLAKITAAAYAMVYPALYTDLALPPLQAMQCEVPVVAANTGALPSICSDAALYADPGDFKDIAENMMLVFKDEDKAKGLVRAGKALMQQYQCDRSADLLMQLILKAINN
jgi:glycosyltransferase involved in cell wall biosynthesis